MKALLILGIALLPGCALSFDAEGLPTDLPDVGGIFDDAAHQADADDIDGGLAMDASLLDVGLGLDASTDVDILLTTMGSPGVWIRSTPSDLDCSGSCHFLVAPGSSWSLVAQPVVGTQFEEWSMGPCEASTNPTCEVTAEEGLHVGASFKRL